MGKSWEHGGTNHHQWRFERKKHWTSGLSGLSIVLKYQRIYPEAISIQKACQNVAKKMPQNHPSLKLCTHWNHLSSVPKPCVVPLYSFVDRDSLLMDCDTPQYVTMNLPGFWTLLTWFSANHLAMWCSSTGSPIFSQHLRNLRSLRSSKVTLKQINALGVSEVSSKKMGIHHTWWTLTIVGSLWLCMDTYSISCVCVYSGHMTHYYILVYIYICIYIYVYMYIIWLICKPHFPKGGWLFLHADAASCNLFLGVGLFGESRGSKSWPMGIPGS
jgi:hypothetical protein